MDKNRVKENLIRQWVNIADRDLLAAKQGLEANPVLTEIVCFHCQQGVENFLKAFLVQSQIEFEPKHNIMTLLNQCIQVDKEFKELSDLLKLNIVERTPSQGKKEYETDIMADYAVDIRYPNEHKSYERSLAEVGIAYSSALKVKDFIFKKIKFS